MTAPAPDFDAVLYGEVASSFNFSSMSKDFTLAKCRMCGGAVSADEESLEMHKAFHVALAELGDRLIQ